MSPGDPISLQLIRFGIFQLDLASGELRRNGAKVKLQEQPLQILKVLLQNPGRVVSREDLRRRIWPEDTFVDFDRGLYSALARLRDALSDSANSPQFIETVPRRGYRFITSVETVTVAPPGEARSAPAPPKSARRFLILARASLVLVTCSILAFLLNSRISWIPRFTRAAPPIHSLAVLPVENLSGDATQEYLADGMTDELITALAQLGNVQVISRASVMRFKGTRTPLSQIARELHVDAIIEGSFVRSGQHVRITAQLIDPSTDRHFWARSYERDIRDILTLQSEVAGAIADEVSGKLTPQQRARLAAARPSNPEAYSAYLKSRYFVHNQRSAEGVRKSLEYSLQAVQIDPNWAPAYAGLAGSYVSANYLDALPPQEVWPKAKAAAQKALQLDPDLSEAHVALGEVLENFDFDYSAAESEFRRAIELSPSNSHAHQSYADFLAILGQAHEAISEIKLAQQLDPMSFWVSRDVGRMLYEARLYDQALAALREAAEMNPHSPVVYNWLSWTYDKKGMIPDSVEMDLKDEATNGASEEVLAQLRKAFEKSGQNGYLKKKLELTKSDGYVMAQINARLGNRDQAFRWLEKAYEQRSGYLVLLKVDPELDNLRSDHRFEAHLRRLNLLQ